MKLYTEEQVRKAMLHSYLSGVERPADYLPIEESILRELTPIELPSDEEIDKKADEYVENKWEYAQDECKEAFTDCAKWLRDKILTQNK